MRCAQIRSFTTIPIETDFSVGLPNDLPSFRDGLHSSGVLHGEHVQLQSVPINTSGELQKISTSQSPIDGAVLIS